MKASLKLGVALHIVANFIVYFSGGYIMFPLGFVAIKQASMLSPKGGVVLLKGMIHVADEDFYLQTREELKLLDFTVLAEGVSDKNGTMEKFDYSGVAEFAGLVSQGKNIFADKLKIVGSDLDVSDLSDKTVEALAASSVARSALISYINGDISKQELRETLKPVRSTSLHDIDEDIIVKRNRNLMDNHILKRQEENLAVPWGAAHMSGLEEELSKRGYIKTHSEWSVAINLWSVFFSVVNSH